MKLNEGLEKLGSREVINGVEYAGGAFDCSAVESVRLPSTLKRVEDNTFWNCKHLKNVEIPTGVECLGNCCFSQSGIEEITLPSTLIEVE